MNGVPNPDFGGDPSPAAQQVALDRLKYMIGLLPSQEIDLPVPDVDSPVVIDLAARRRAFARQALGNRCDMLEAAAAGFKALGEPISPQLRQAYLDLVHDVIAFQQLITGENLA